MAKKLLVADDSLTIQKVIKLALSGDGYEIHTVSDGTECLQQVALFRPDVVLIDVGLPGRSAFDIKKTANDDADLSRIPFVLMSSAFEKVDEAKVALLKFDGRLTKPFDPSNLKNVLMQALKMNSGQGVKEFSPSPPPPPNPFSPSPSDRSHSFSSHQLSIAEEPTGEIQLLDPTDKIPHDPAFDPLWSENTAHKLENTINLDVQRAKTPPPAPATDDSDIRHLTESTVRMSGLDDLDGWNLSEGAKGMETSIPDIFSPTSPNIEMPSGGLQDPEPTLSGYSPSQDFSPSSSNPFESNPTQWAAPSRNQSESAPAFSPESADQKIAKQIEKQVREQLESLVQGAVKSQLEQMARKALPEITERIVKAEIRKLLDGLAGSGD